MRYVEIAPAPPLRRYIRCYWMLGGDGRAPGEPEPILPDGGWEIVFQLGDHFDQWEGTFVKRQPETLLVADVCRPITIAPAGVIDTMGVRFRPGGAYRFFDEPMSELSGDLRDLSAVWPEAESARERLGDSSGWQERPQILDRLFLTKLSRRAGIPELDRLMQYVRNHPRERVSALSSMCGLSDRQLQRRFLRSVGLSPKMFLSVLRFDDLVRRIMADAIPWTDAALDHGYFDQSHMIHEFRRFSGMTPRQFARSILPLNDSFRQPDTDASGFSNTSGTPVTRI